MPPRPRAPGAQRTPKLRRPPRQRRAARRDQPQDGDRLEIGRPASGRIPETGARHRRQSKIRDSEAPHNGHSRASADGLRSGCVNLDKGADTMKPNPHTVKDELLSALPKKSARKRAEQIVVNERRPDG